MLTEREIISICKYSYNSFQIPFYLYSEKELIASIPDDLSQFNPKVYLDYTLKNETVVDYVQTANNCFFGIIKIEKTNYTLIVGPASSVQLSDRAVREILHELQLRWSNSSALEYFYRIPAYSQLEFMDSLLFIQYILNKKEISRDDFFKFQAESLTDRPNEEYIANQSYSDSDNSFLIQPDSILMHIESGNVDGVMDYLCSPQNMTPINWGKENLISHKQIAYYSIVLFSEAARRGGLPIVECTEIVRSYYSDITKLNDIEHIDFLIGRCALFFAEKVREIPLPQNIDQSLLSCVQYIRQNIYTKITVDDVATQLGYSRSHTSKLFKDKLGFTPGEFIIRLKLEESKILLSHSDKSITEIATLLGFSSQSHFHQTFKKQFNMTPFQFRSTRHAPL